MPPTGDLTHNPGMCPDWELNSLEPFGSQTGAQSTEPHQPGWYKQIFLTVSSSLLKFDWPQNVLDLLTEKNGGHLLIRHPCLSLLWAWEPGCHIKWGKKNTSSTYLQAIKLLKTIKYLCEATLMCFLLTTWKKGYVFFKWLNYFHLTDFLLNWFSDMQFTFPPWLLYRTILCWVSEL